ncbi:hypothetical protein Lepto7375DRAFT_0088 [Leptolyngbya sp. PCC 7375]|nr:hypothetical protein Lepto7375DRAFT_0088 [Leptolyngbya sp. PCC 7375]
MKQVLKEEKRVFVGPLLLFNTGLQVIMAIMLMIGCVLLSRLFQVKRVYVQTQNGQVISAHSVSSQTRETETIRQFTKQIIRGLFQMAIDPELAAQDEGLETIDVDGTTVKIPLTMLQASYGLADELQLPMLRELGQAIPQSVLDGHENYIVVFHSVSDPIPIADQPGTWEIQVLGYQKVFQAPNRIVKSVPLRKRVIVEITEMPLAPNSTHALEGAIFQIRKFGLQVKAIHTLKEL